MSISQAGVYSLKLYENKDFTFDYNDSELIILSSISNTGDIIELETNDNFIKYDNKLVPAENNTTLNDHTLAFEINGLIQSNLDIIEKLQSSIYGWIALITFMDIQVYLINIPFHLKVDKFDSQVTHTFFIEMKPRIFTFEKLEGVDITPIISIPTPNAGAEGTTDWINPTAGLADLWNDNGNNTPSISSGNGFVGNCQRIDTLGITAMELISDLFTFVEGQTYKLSFKYRSSSPESLSNVYIRDSVSFTTVLEKLPTNIGDAASYLSSEFSNSGTEMDIYIWFANSGTPQYIEIDEVKIIQQ